ncbi:MAG: hypothetical protein HY912_12470 [Desulfomonile tiedjei]|uniref:Uncharacterized protein n=1 Tax=Desulfomonile tiedjei TaxID=2358 RepID=A0A9D6V5G6_9BACT|nr:hypothetical protein [Desulfomonile tiedjei]
MPNKALLFAANKARRFAVRVAHSVANRYQDYPGIRNARAIRRKLPFLPSNRNLTVFASAVQASKT